MLKNTNKWNYGAHTYNVPYLSTVHATPLQHRVVSYLDIHRQGGTLHCWTGETVLVISRVVIAERHSALVI